MAAEDSAPARPSRTRVRLRWRLAFKASILDVYDSQPAEDTERNSLTTLVGLSVGF